jgi:hypothetical protein
MRKQTQNIDWLFVRSLNKVRGPFSRWLPSGRSTFWSIRVPETEADTLCCRATLRAGAPSAVRPSTRSVR